MENSDMFGSSTAPLTWHDFLERMRQPSAADFVKAIKSFIVSFSNNPADPERDSAAVQGFLSNMETAFRAHSLWAGCSEEELESAGEGLEKYVMTKLFPRVFAALPEDVKIDDQLHEKMALIQQFIRPENLDIKPTYQNETSWLLAQKELQKINMYRAPRDKLVCILNCCKVISNLLMNASVASSESPPGADEFLPVLIYVTIKANPPQLHSNLLYIQRYRRESRLVSEAAYYFTNLLSAESFILNIDANSISMDETEFENNMESARAILFGLSAESDNLFHQTDKSLVPRPETAEPKRQQSPPTMRRGPTSQSQLSIGSNESKLDYPEEIKDQQLLPPKVQSTSDLESKGAAVIMEEDQVDKIFRDFPFFFSRSGDLTVGDVDELLSNYKELVFKYVCLAKGLGISNPSPSLPGPSLHQTEKVQDSEDSGAAAESKSEEEKESAKRGDDDYSNEVSMLSMQNSSSLKQDETAALEKEVNDDETPR